MGIPGLLEASAKTHTELRKRGIRHMIGGDYGFKWSPNGSNARDLDFFVKSYGYTRAEALRCATAHGGAATMIDSGEKMGEIKEGHLAAPLLVAGVPLAAFSVFVNT